VAPDGTVTYVTEGQLRALHRRVSEEPPPYPVFGPHHSFRRADAVPLSPGEAAELRFTLFPTSVRFRSGHRVRVALAGHDNGNFRRVPESGRPRVIVHRDGALRSRIELPVGNDSLRGRAPSVSRLRSKSIQG
jgi:predicted acyl esterase